MFRKIAASLRSLGVGVAAVVPELAKDIAGIACIGSIAFGCWMIYQPAGFIAGGVLGLGAVVLVSR